MILKSFQKKTKNGMSKTELPSLAFWQSALFWILFQDICWGQVSFPCIPAGLVKSKCSCERKEREVAQSCPTLCDPVDCSLPGFSIHGILQARIWSGLPFPSPGDLPNPEIEPGSPTLEADALTSEPPGNLVVVNYKYISKVNCMSWGLPSKLRPTLL